MNIFSKIFAACSILLAGCTTTGPQDYANYDFEDFKKHKARCNVTSQCKIIGYGSMGGCNPSNNFAGYIIYSTSMGKENIKHLESVVKNYRRSSNSFVPLNLIDGEVYAFLEQTCVPAGRVPPKLSCKNNICIDTRKY